MIIRIGWNDAISSSMYEKHVIKSIDEFRSLDDDSVKTLCKVLLQPGGVTETGDPYPGVKAKSRS